MIENKDIVFIGIQAFNIPSLSNARDLALTLAKKNRVLYVNPPLQRVVRYREKHKESVREQINVVKSGENKIQEIHPGLWNCIPGKMSESINFISGKSVYNFLNRINLKRFAKNINDAISELGFKDVILFNDMNMFMGRDIPELIGAKQSVYYIRDFLLSQDYFRRHGQFYEPRLMEKYDAVVCNSEYLKNYSLKFNKHSYFIGQGHNLFKVMKGKANGSVDYSKYSGPIIAYAGNITSLRLDEGLIKHIAEKKPEWNLLFHGKIDQNFKNSPVFSIENVHYLGEIDFEYIPEFLKAADVCINPQRLWDFTVGNYPVKIDEYLALGKPVVVTKTEATAYFNQLVYEAKNYDEFVQYLEKAIAEKDEELLKKRVEMAKDHSWERSAERLSMVISKL